MRINSLGMIVICFLVITGCSQQSEPQPKKSSPVASYIFLGTINKDKPNALVYNVRVDKTYHQRGTFDDQTGREIELTGDDIPASGQYVFHTEPYHFGKRVAAVLVNTEKPRAYTEKNVNELKQTFRRQQLVKRVKGAELIVIGKVEATKKWEGRLGADSEHNPDFMWAKIAVNEVLHGRVEGGTHEFLFASSDDVHWFRAPKPGVGKSGLFLLSRGAEGPGMNIGKTWTLLHPDDFLKGDDIQIIRLIIKEGGA